MLNGEKYEYQTNSSFLDYEFMSIGKKGNIKKVARFNLIQDNLFNFGFGDLNESSGEISDTTISNNGDGDKVLITVATIIFEFTEYNKGDSVFIQGTTKARTRRYQMGINKHWLQLKSIFTIWGLIEGSWEKFQKGRNYEAFIGTRKYIFR